MFNYVQGFGTFHFIFSHGERREARQYRGKMGSVCTAATLIANQIRIMEDSHEGEQVDLNCELINCRT